MKNYENFKIFKNKYEMDLFIETNYPTQLLKHISYYYNESGVDDFYVSYYKGALYPFYNELLRNPNANSEELYQNAIRNASNLDKPAYRTESKEKLTNKEILYKHINHIQYLISNLKIHENISVFRFISEEEYSFYNRNKSTTIEIPQFLSTTTIPHFSEAHEYTQRKHLIKILLPTGTNALAIPEVNSSYEFEILLPHHGKLKYLGRTKHKETLFGIPTFLYENPDFKKTIDYSIEYPKIDF